MRYKIFDTSRAVGLSLPCTPSHTKPSSAWWSAKSSGSNPNRISLRSFTCVSVVTPTPPITTLPPKLAAADQHIDLWISLHCSARIAWLETTDGGDPLCVLRGLWGLWGCPLSGV